MDFQQKFGCTQGQYSQAMEMKEELEKENHPLLRGAEDQTLMEIAISLVLLDDLCSQEGCTKYELLEERKATGRMVNALVLTESLIILDYFDEFDFHEQYYMSLDQRAQKVVKDYCDISHCM